MGRRKAGEAVAKGVSSLFDDAFEKIGTATTRGARRQKQRKSNVFKRDAKTGQVRSVTRGERVKRGQKVTGGAAAATGAAAAGSAAMADKDGKKQSTKVGKMKRGDSVKRTETPKKAGATRGERKQKTSPRGVSVGRSKPKPTLNKQGAAAFAKAMDEAGKRKAAKKAEAEAKAKAEAEKKKDKEKKTIFGLEVKPSKNGRFAGRGGKRRRVAGRAMGGMMKSKMASKGGARGGKRMPPGMKAGGSASKFPDLSGDGKVTQKDILMGKGVIKKQAGGMMKSKMASKGGAKGGRKPGGMRRGGMARAEANALARARRGAGGGPVAGAANMQRLAQQALKGFGGGGVRGRGFQSQAGGLAAQQAAGAQAAQAAGGRRRRRQAGGPSGGPMGAMAGMGGAMPQQQLTAQFMANGGMAKKKPKGYAKGGASTKKGFSKGGSVRGKPRGVGVAMRGFGKALKK